MLSRRSFMAALASTSAAPAFAQHAGHDPVYSNLTDPKVTAAPTEIMQMQQVFDSPAPKAANQGKWVTRAPLPLPRSEMAWATVLNNKMHLVGGKLYAIAGFVEQNRKPDNLCYVLEGETWRTIAPLPKAAAAIACVELDGLIHAIGGAVGDTFADKKSVDWHLVYDPRIDQWNTRKAMPTGRDHTGTLTVNGLIHVIGGRVDSFHTNSNLHHAYDAKTDKWEPRAPLPTARSGHGAVFYRGKIFIMGGEGTNRVFGQNEAYDPVKDSWESYAPMMTPRHGLGAVAIGDFIHVAGGGPVMGGNFQSAVHEAFTLG